MLSDNPHKCLSLVRIENHVINRRNLLIVLPYIFLSALLMWGVYTASFRTGLATMQRSGAVRLAQAEDRLLGQLEAFRELANFLAQHPEVVSTAQGENTPSALNELFLRAALTSGADDIYYLEPSGTVTASSNFEEDISFIGLNYAARPDVTSAATGRLGVYHGIEPADDTRDFFYTRGVLSETKKPLAFIVVKVNAALLEFNWRIDENVVTFIDDDGVSFLANRPGLLMRIEEKGTPTRYPSDALRAFYPYQQDRIGTFNVWTFEDGLEVPREALIADRSIPIIDMTARIFMDVTQAREPAFLQAALAGAFMAVTGMLLFAISQRRHRIADRLTLEEAANARLEARVAERTEQLKQAQNDLIQASKLTALGQMSAGISHELNQPLATIQNYAENSKKLIDRGREEDAKLNLAKISEQTTRMGRIIQNLRSFARKETEPLEVLNIDDVIAEAVSLSETRCAEANVEIRVAPHDDPILVRAGKVRLQQVIVNLISNAVDALSDQPEKLIKIETRRSSSKVMIDVSDTGPGLAEIERVFEPFYTTKDIGASKGLGLGLSISYGIIGSFGGDLKAKNRTDGGAQFIIELPINDEGTR